MTSSETKSEIEIREGRKVTLVGVAVNAGLIAVKIIGGVLGHSQALIADAVHSFSDFFTDLVVLFALKYGRKEPDSGHPFGHGRIETAASAVVGLTLLAVGLFIGLDAALRIYRHTESHPTVLALAAAGLSILSKEGLYHYTVIVGRRIRSRSVMANAWHHRSDAMSSVAVFFGVGGAILNPAWRILDAYAALLVSFFILKVGLDVIWDSLKEMTDTAPQPEVIEKIDTCARGVEGVLGVHDLRVRSSAGKLQMEIHVVVDGGMTVIQGHRIAKEVESCLLRDVDDSARIIVHVDPDE